jgi:L-ribulose-5-phosphate 3-epimerase
MNRRSFLQLAAASGTLATAAPRVLGRQAEPRKPLKKGIMFATVGIEGASVMDKFKAIKAAGFDGVEPMSHMSQDEVLRARDVTGLELPSVCCGTHWAKPITHPSKEVRAAGIAGLKQALLDAKRYGASSVLFVAGIVNAEIPYEDALKRAHAELLKVVDFAEEQDVFIAIENVWNNFMLSPVEAAQFVDSLNSDNVGWHFDVGNIINSGWPEQWIRTLGPRIQKLHIKEFSRAKADKQGKWAGFDVEFLKGDNNWPAVMKALDDIQYHGWGIAEQPGAGSAEGLKKLSGEMDRIFAS